VERHVQAHTAATDGSKLSSKAVERGIAFAKKIKARVTAVHVVPSSR